jgi:hypothetical protein
LKINHESGNIEKIFLMTVKQMPSDVVHLSNLKFHENDIYYTNKMTNPQYPGMIPSYYFIKSADNGKSWDRFYFRFCLVNFIENDKIFNLRYRNSQIALSVLEDSPHPDSLATETVITDTSTPPERYQSLVDQSIKDVIRISKDTMVAVGTTKTIAVSVDGGKKWILKSRYRHQLYHDLSYHTVNRPPVFINSKTIFNSNRYRSFDGGITWLPPLTSENENVEKLSTDFYYFNKDGTGMTMMNDGLSLYMLKTEDFGETYSQTIINPPISNSYGERQYLCFKSNNKIYLPRYNSNKIFSYIYIFNDNYELEKTTIVDSTRISNIVSDKNSNLFLFGLYQPNGNEDGESWQYQLIRSTDAGSSWDRILPDMAVESKIVNGVNYLTSIKDIYTFEKYIILPNIYTEPTLLYLFDTETEILDSLEIPFFLSRSDEAIFSFKGDFYAISSNNTIYKTSNFPSKDAVWDSVHISKYLYDWKDYEPGSRVAGRDIIYSTWADEEQIYLVVNRSTYEYVAGGLEFMFKTNIVKLFKDEPTSVEEVENVESERVYLWSGNPYPTPTKDMVRTKIYWNSVYDIENAKIEFYDLYGSKLINPKYTIEHHNIYSADIVWDCSEYRNGIYFMHVSLGGDSKLVKMIIAK